jgi:hypothetical protein
VALTGLEIEAKAEVVEAAFWRACPYEPSDFAAVDARVLRTDQPDADSNEAATAQWRITVKDTDERKVGRAFSNAFIETALTSIPGLYGLGGGPSAASPYGVYRPAKVHADLVPAHVHVGGATRQIGSVAPAGTVDIAVVAPQFGAVPDGPSVRAPLGRLIGARSGDKGGDANVGVFARSAPAYAWVRDLLTVDRLRVLLPEAADLRIDRHELPNIWSLNFVVHGLLQEGVAASTRTDAQAKSLGEWLRSRVVDIPTMLLDS